MHRILCALLVTLGCMKEAPPPRAPPATASPPGATPKKQTTPTPEATEASGAALRAVTELTDDLPRVALFGDTIFVLEQNGLFRVSKGGQDKTTLVNKIGPQRCGLFAGEGALYWSKISGYSEMPSGGYIRVVPLKEGIKEKTVKGLTFPESLTALGDSFYSVDWYNGKVTRHGPNGNTVLADGGDGFDMLSLCTNRIVTDGTWLYYSFADKKSVKEGVGISSSVMKLSPSGGKPTTLFTQVGQISELTIEGEYLYWMAQSKSIYRAKVTGGEPQELAKTRQYSNSTIVVKGEYVYWLDGFSRSPYYLSRVPKAGGEVEVLYEGKTLASTVLLADDKELFWIELQPKRLVAFPLPAK